MLDLRKISRLPTRERFDLSYIPEPNSGCWLWLGTVVSRMGYGQFQIDGQLHYAHRASWLLHNGSISEGRFILHRCDNPSCVNPSHLFEGTHKDNMRDMALKGRAKVRRGEEGTLAKLTWADVNQIRESSRPQRALAAQYGVSQSTIGRAMRKETFQEAGNG